MLFARLVTCSMNPESVNLNFPKFTAYDEHPPSTPPKFSDKKAHFFY